MRYDTDLINLDYYNPRKHKNNLHVRLLCTILCSSTLKVYFEKLFSLDSQILKTNYTKNNLQIIIISLC